MKKTFYRLFILLFALSLYDCGPKVKPQSEVDTPEYHFRAGMRYLDDGEYEKAKASFQQSVDLDKKFASGWAGLGLVTGLKGDLKQGRKYMDKGLGLAKKNPDVHVLAGRLWIAHRSADKKWIKKAEKEFERALKLKPKHEAATYYLGMAYLYDYQFGKAEDQFKKVVDKKGEYAGKADEMWETSQKIVRAKPGTPAGKKIALQFKITRADLAVLFVEELKLTEIFERFLPSNSPAFQTPAQLETQQKGSHPKDIKGNWAERWISEALELGVMEPDPDGKFYPAEEITRANYARAVARILVAVTRDTELETRYFGESPSRFSDVSSSHYAYPAMALCAERGIMKADLVSGKFDPSGTVSGADALLIIRNVQNALRLTF